MRTLTLCLLLSLIASKYCLAQTQEPADSKTTAAKVRHQQSVSSKTADAIRQNLNQPIDFDFKEKPWSEVENYLEEKLDCQIVLTQSARDDSLTNPEPITCQLKSVAAKNAIRLMLVEKNATYIVRDGVLQIISLDDADDIRNFSCHFINVRDLLSRIAELDGIKANQPRSGKISGGNGDPEFFYEKSALQNLLDLTMNAVEPDGWMDTGQGEATIDIIAGIMVVSGPETMADQVKDFIQDLKFHVK